MHSLHSCQSAFREAIFSGSESSENALLPMLLEPDAVALRRLSAYRNSIIGNLSAALRSCYPVVARIVGMPFFNEAARRFILAVPSESGDLNEYGETFGDFLAGYPHAAGLAYLPDVTRLEWLVQQVFHAREAPAADLAVLTQIPEDRYGDLCFSVTPACARMDSSWPLADIWRVNQDAFDGDMAIDFSRGAQVLILRRRGLVYVEALAAAEAVLLDVLATRQPLAVATDRAMAVDAGFDLGAALYKFVGQGLLWRAQIADDSNSHRRQTTPVP
ncbi:MAG: DNA-binding domain-containing protein [Proteobacteria bacterium]|nr:DNA-binding domain-containing protein [Pseudomonadota bacterium]